jgi:hypothetical protein
VAESARLPSFAERHAEFAARIEKIRQMAGLGGATPASNDDIRAARVARVMPRRRNASPTAGQEQQRPVPALVGTPAPNSPEKPVREKDVAGLLDELPPPQGSTRAQDFLRKAYRTLEREALQREVQDANADIWNGDTWFSALDREADAEAHYSGALIDHERAYRHFAGVLDVEDTAEPEKVREAITSHVERAKVRKAQAIERRDALGRVPKVKELSRSFYRLGLKDRNSVLQQLHAVRKLVPQALKLAVQLAEGPGHHRGGRSL